MKLVGCAVLALSLIAGTANAAEWSLLYANKEVAFAFDAASIKQVAGRKLAWVAFIYPDKNLGSDYSLERWEFDCAREMTTVTSFVAYDIEGQVTTSNDQRQRTLAAVPESPGKMALDAVCDIENYHDPDPSSAIRDLVRGYRLYVESAD
ncbi:surface-adhesin E family protein [Brevundimonas diminuta]|uniref:surface-adhesin E family protein n=1 Tax=Brevundimonas diminuta TaxID=293 RepID=UPI001F59183F|nr:surface-adhesin E family protein [Brevundimonas diminuta]